MKKVYFAGELFSGKHLLGNAVLAEAMERVSGGRYRFHLPQNMEQRVDTAHAIRDDDLEAVAGADVGVFNYDGPELDSGTVVEYIYAKCADIPAVLVRTDFRVGGDGEEPWNLMTSFFPRTEVVLLNALALYKEALESDQGPTENRSVWSAQQVIERAAHEVVAAMDRAIATEPVMPEELRDAVHTWLALMPGFGAKTFTN